MFSSIELIVFGIILFIFLMISRIIPNLLALVGFLILILLSYIIIPGLLVSVVIFLLYAAGLFLRLN